MTQNAQLKAGSDTEPAFSLPGPLRNECAIWLVRHGETEWSRSGQHTGRTDIPLTEHGEEQARALRPLLDGVHPTLVLSSPRSRAVRTAELAGVTIDAIDADLAEWDYGDYEGITTADIRRQVPNWSLWRDGVPNGETARQVGVRADRVLARAAREIIG